MDVSTVQEAFIRAAKKPKVLSYKTREVIDCAAQAIEQALAEVKAADNDKRSSHWILILKDLRKKLNELAPVKHLEGSQKEIIIGLSRYIKTLEKEFTPDISTALINADWDTSLINGIIACHFYQEGMFDVGDCFMHEAHVSDAGMLRSEFVKMHQILEAMRSRDLEPALNWAMSQHDQLLQSGSNLELELHSLQFLEKVQKGNRREALEYAKIYLAPFTSSCKQKISQLMACLLWVGRLSESPYADFTSPAQWDKSLVEFTQQFCNLMGQSSRSPLSMVLTAGFHALPIVLKMAAVSAVTGQNWQEVKQLPSAVELPDNLQFHSVFVCPVLWERSTEDNPPMMLPCGHVLCKQAIVKMSNSASGHPFKCPFCPDEARLAQCRQLHF